MGTLSSSGERFGHLPGSEVLGAVGYNFPAASQPSLRGSIESNLSQEPVEANAHYMKARDRRASGETSPPPSRSLLFTYRAVCFAGVHSFN